MNTTSIHTSEATTVQGPANHSKPSPIIISSTKNVSAVWSKFFPDVPLTEPKWLERWDPILLENALTIAAEKDRAGGFKVRDQANIGRYVSKVARNLKNGIVTRDARKPIELKVTFTAGYQIQERDRKRFEEKLSPAGDCLLFHGVQHAGGYGRFWVDQKLIGAHVFGLFLEHGYLPAEGELDGLEVAHSCGRRNCCNPRHLRLTTQAINLSERRYQTAEGESGIDEAEVIAVNSLTNPSSPAPSFPPTSDDL